MIGQTISHYRIVDKLGEGGMGVVYKAEDTKLERTVALKFLAAHLLDNDEAKERFLREAKAAAALSHPNICHVYEIDEAEGKTFISMAFVDGETLDDHIAQRPLPIKDALDVGQQIAKGLEAAHGKGIVHRDIKPANVLVAADGQVTIMDFGLARLTEASRLTKADATMGTVAYMSPEQAQGAEVDHRTDIWALGCVLYEMVAGLRPFKGQYDQALLYEIVNQQPEPLTGVRAGLPMELEFIVGKCLAKDAADRYQHASEIAVDLRTLAEKLKSGRSTILRTPSSTSGVPATMTGVQTLNPVATLPPDVVLVKRNSHRALQALTAAATLAFLVVAAVHFTAAPPETPEKLVRRFSFSHKDVSHAYISPDGKWVMYRGSGGNEPAPSIWIRSLATETSRELAGTGGADPLPFWSTDSAWIGFAVGDELKKVSLEGGSPLKLAKLPSETTPFVGGTWSPDGKRIVFSSGLRLYQIPDSGGVPELMFDPGEDPHPRNAYPQFLPAAGPPALLYTAATNINDRWLAVLNLETGERRELGPGARAVYSREGYLIYEPSNNDEQGLWARAFSLQTLEPTGNPFPISTAGYTASVSNDGTLAFRDKSTDMADTLRSLVWRDRKGTVLEKVGQPQMGLREFELSPDGRFVATTVAEPTDIWVQDLARSTVSRLTFSPEYEYVPRWLPSGKEIIFTARPQPDHLMRVAADGSGEPVVVLERGVGTSLADWSPDGRYVAFQGSGDDPATQADIFYVGVGDDGAPGAVKTFLSTPAEESAVQFSPNGRLLAYVSDESGRPEVYLRPFPVGAGRWQVSVNGGAQPRWRRDGKELFYVQNQSLLMAVSIEGGETPTLGQPQQLFESQDLAFRSFTWPMYDVAADGQRFLTSTLEGEAPPLSVRIVQNWYEEFRDREQD